MFNFLFNVILGALAGFGLWCLLTSPADAGETRVRDGDTIVVSGTPVRLKGLHCAELSEEMGRTQRDYLAAWMSRASEVSCTLTGEKTYDREVGWCELDGYDIGKAMITNAFCQPCRRYDSDGRYSHLPVTGPVPKYCN